MMNGMNGPSPPAGNSVTAPWMQNESWASGDIPDQAVENLLVLWIFAIVWNAASIPAVIPYVKEAIKAHDASPLLALAFPVAGLGLLAWAAYRTMRVRKFGASVFHLRTLPAKPGGDLAGTIHVAQPLASASSMRLRLMCVHRLRGQGSRSGIREHVIWQEAQTLDQLPRCSDGTDIPVSFRIPPDARPSSSVISIGDQILWRLEAGCKAFGVSYRSRFEVPVFIVTGAETAAAPAGDLPIAQSHLQSPNWRGNFTERGIVREPMAGGGCRIHFAAARNKTSAMVTTVVGLLFTGIAVCITLIPGIPLMRVMTLAFAAVPLLIGGLFDYIAIFLWFVSRDITVQHDTLVIESGTPLFRRRQTFRARDVSDVFFKVDGGSSVNGSAEKKSFGIMLKTRDGKSIWVANNISQGNYAAWLADQIKITLGS